jgi:deoxyribodipyrimidine photolyase-like uncharacterized protein
MTLKLTKQQLNALYTVFVEIILTERFDLTEPQDLLINSLMVKVFKKIRAQVERPAILKSYGLNLSTEEAIAYYAYFTECPMFLGGDYEETMILDHTTHIHTVLTNQIKVNEQFNGSTTKVLR